MGSPQIRGAGTVGGNIANGSPAADCVVPLVALDAEVLLASKLAGARQRWRRSFARVPGEVNMGKDELIVQRELRHAAAGTRSASSSWAGATRCPSRG